MSAATLPSVDEAHIKPQRKQQQPKLPEVDTPKTQEEITGYVRRRIDVRMPRKHAEILHKKLRDLQDSGALLLDGMEVRDHTKAILWILENLDRGN